MADFVQIMKDWRRMCITAADGPDTLKCGNCPMGQTRMCAFEISDIGDYELQEAETTIATWAAEHPVVYPTWLEWLKSMGIIPYMMGLVTTRDEDGVFDDGHVRITESALKEIPADIAKKLGFEPKEG